MIEPIERESWLRDRRVARRWLGPGSPRRAPPRRRRSAGRRSVTRRRRTGRSRRCWLRPRPTLLKRRGRCRAGRGRSASGRNRSCCSPCPRPGRRSNCVFGEPGSRPDDLLEPGQADLERQGEPAPITAREQIDDETGEHRLRRATPRSLPRPWVTPSSTRRCSMFERHRPTWSARTEPGSPERVASSAAASMPRRTIARLRRVRLIQPHHRRSSSACDRPGLRRSHRALDLGSCTSDERSQGRDHHLVLAAEVVDEPAQRDAQVPGDRAQRHVGDARSTARYSTTPSSSSMWRCSSGRRPIRSAPASRPHPGARRDRAPARAAGAPDGGCPMISISKPAGSVDWRARPGRSRAPATRPE